MDFFEMLSERRSIRRFSNEQIAESDIDKILKAALDAPSSKNTRSSAFIVVENAETIARISKMRDYGSAFVEKAPLVILITGDTSKTDLWHVNASITATYVQLAAESLGLGNCWVHINERPHKQDEPLGITAEEYLRTFLDIPRDKRLFCAIAIGHKEESPNETRKYYGDSQERITKLR